MRVYLADLGHNLITKTSDVYPLGVANLAAYAKANATSKSPLQFEIFREPQELKEAIDKAAPDVLGLSSYSWNHRLALAFALYLKRRRPQSLTLMGGPNFPLTRGEQDDQTFGALSGHRSRSIRASLEDRLRRLQHQLAFGSRAVVASQAVFAQDRQHFLLKVDGAVVLDLGDRNRLLVLGAKQMGVGGDCQGEQQEFGVSQSHHGTCVYGKVGR